MKIEDILMNFAKCPHEGPHNGVVFFSSYPALDRAITQVIAPDETTFSRRRDTWTLEGGRTLSFAAVRGPDDYWNHHGCAWPWVCLAGEWDDETRERLASLCKSLDHDTCLLQIHVGEQL